MPSHHESVSNLPPLHTLPTLPEPLARGTGTVGYRKVFIGDAARFEVVPEEVASVAAIFDFLTYSEKITLSGYRKHFEGREPLRSTGTPIPFDTACVMGTNPIYAGYFRWHDELYAGLHEPLVPNEVFLKVRERLLTHRPTERKLRPWEMQPPAMADLELVNRAIATPFVPARLSPERIEADKKALYAGRSEKIKEVLAQKRERGEAIGAPPVGYRIVRMADGTKRIEEDPVMIPLVREARELHATGRYSVRELLRIMTGKGLRSRSGKVMGVGAFWNVIKP